jgi:hypothetical protein
MSPPDREGATDRVDAERNDITPDRHCERSEAIQERSSGLLRFARNDEVVHTFKLMPSRSKRI